mmetsp:Transcript_28354/g.50675  ORF Transcript_28354/g.50675 Transcript_28354/m.50675 type:complete len:107 (-) Transcript_28354:519-839(-)
MTQKRKTRVLTARHPQRGSTRSLSAVCLQVLRPDTQGVNPVLPKAWCLLHSLEQVLSVRRVSHGNAPCNIQGLLGDGDRHIGQVGTIISITWCDDFEVEIGSMAGG